MPLPIIADVYRVALNWTNVDLPGQAATNVMHFHAPGKSAVQVATALNAHMSAGMFVHTGPHALVEHVDITRLDGSSLSLPYTPATPANWRGGVTSTAFVPQVCCLVKLRTAKRGRSYRGRIFLPWVVEEAIDQGKIPATNVANMTTAWTAFGTAMAGDGIDHVVASYVHSTTENVVLYTCETFTATQKRRLRRTSV